MFEYSVNIKKNNDSLVVIAEKINDVLADDDDFNEMLSLYDDPFWWIYPDTKHSSLILEIHAEMAFLDKQWIKDHLDKVAEKEMGYKV